MAIPVAEMTEKGCPDCERVLPAVEFHSNLRRADGLAFYCKPCAAVRSEKSRRARGISQRRVPPTGVAVGSKWCPDCDQIKSTADFPRTRANSATGLHTYCKPCHNLRGRLSRDKVGGSRNYHLKRRYAITGAQADAMLAEQDGLCAVCRVAPAAHVDHDHATGKVRGLLCFNCNGGLGQFKDRIDVLEAGVDYLRSHAVTEAASPAGAIAPPAPRGRWPRVIELFPYRGAETYVKRRRHPIGA